MVSGGEKETVARALSPAEEDWPPGKATCNVLFDYASRLSPPPPHPGQSTFPHSRTTLGFFLKQKASGLILLRASAGRTVLTIRAATVKTEETNTTLRGDWLFADLCCDAGWLAGPMTVDYNNT